MTEQFLFDATAIRDVLQRLDSELARRGIHDVTLIVVGGAAMALEGYRERSTTDIDTVTELERDIKDAIADIAGDSLPTRWLNDHARPWRPQGMPIEDCHAVFEGDALTVLCPHPRWLALMKINRSLAVDLQDLRALWPHADYPTAQHAVDAFYEAYPLEDPDPHLAHHIQRQIIDKLDE